MGMTNMAATVPGFVVPALVGTLTHGVVSTYTYHTLHYVATERVMHL